ncbi:MAG: delta-60 repeat domain-containing protein, partial [Bacteroidota bacterium]
MKVIFKLLIILFSTGLIAQNRYQINSDFRLDAVSPGAYSIVAKEQEDGKILIGGSFEIVEGSDLSYLIRLNSDGTIDENFNVGGSGPSNHVQDIEVLDDGKILIAMRQGLYYNGEPVSSVVRLNSDGSLDNTFEVGKFLDNDLRFNNSAFALDVQSDGKIIVVGSFYQIGTTKLNGIARLHVDGSIDDTFSVGTGFQVNINNEIAAPATQVQILSDGSIAVLGDFDTYNNNAANKFVILNQDGSFKSAASEAFESFVFPLAFDTEGFIVEQSNGKIVLARDDHDNDKRFIRLNTDGSFDNSFDDNLANERVSSLSGFSNDHLLVKSSTITDILDAD